MQDEGHRQDTDCLGHAAFNSWVPVLLKALGVPWLGFHKTPGHHYNNFLSFPQACFKLLSVTYNQRILLYSIRNCEHTTKGKH